MNSKIWKISVPLLIGIVLFFVAFKFIGLGEILETLRNLYLPLYLLAVVCILSSIFLWTLRWKAFIEIDGRKSSTSELFKSLLVGLAINNLTPFAKFGGEPVRAYLLKRSDGIKMREGLASVLAELTILFIVTLGFITLSLFLIPLVMSPPSWITLIVIPFGIITALVLFGIIGIYSGTDIIIKIIEWFGDKIDRFKPYKKKFIRRYKEFQRIFRKCLENKRAFTKATTAAILAKGLDFAKFFLIFLALGYQIDLLILLVGMGISTIVLSLPTTPGSLGVFESGFISIFVLLGVPPQIAATAVFLDRLVWFWGITVTGGSIGAYYGVNIWESSERKI